MCKCARPRQVAPVFRLPLPMVLERGGPRGGAVFVLPTTTSARKLKMSRSKQAIKSHGGQKPGVTRVTRSLANNAVALFRSEARYSLLPHFFDVTVKPSFGMRLPSTFANAKPRTEERWLVSRKVPIKQRIYNRNRTKRNETSKENGQSPGLPRAARQHSPFKV
jgi:hypothetical protein